MTMRIVYLAKGARGVACLDHMLRSGYAPVAVAHAADPVEPELAALVSECGATLIDGVRPREQAFVEQVAGFEPHLLIMAGYNRIIGRELLSVPRHGVLNLHGGRVPGYRGAAPINWQIINGETEGACTVLYADEGVDTGPVLDEARYPIGPNEDAAQILQRTIELFPPLLVGVLDQFAAGSPPPGRAQKRDAGTWWCRRFPEDGLIDWPQMTAGQVHNLVRALVDPYPNAHTHLDGELLPILRTRLPSRDVRGRPGRVLGREADMVLVGCRDRAIGVVKVKDRQGQVKPAREMLHLYAMLGQ